MYYLLYRNALRQITWLIDIATTPDGAVVCQQLKRNDFEDGKQEFGRRRNRNEMVRAFRQVSVALIAERDDNAVA